MFELSKQGVVDVLSGEDPLCVEELDHLQALFERCLSAGPPRLVVDLQAVPFIDSAGLTWLLDARDDCVERGGLLHLAEPNQLCREILEITGIDAELEVFGNVLAAAGSFAR